MDLEKCQKYLNGINLTNKEKIELINIITAISSNVIDYLFEKILQNDKSKTT